MKRLYLIALFIIVSLTATAQENGNRDAQNRIVREKYLGSQFELKKKDFQLVDEQKRKRDRDRELQG